MRRLAQALALAVALLAAPALAEELVIGRANEPSSMDPQFSRTGNNGMTSQHVFDRLVEPDADNQLKPALAISWKVIEPTLWEIQLREGVKFHDGRPLDAEDVAFSLKRAKEVPNSPASFAGAVGKIAEVEITGPLTLRIRTTVPAPQLIEDIGVVYIVSRTAAAGAASADFAAGKPTIGTGPYRYVSWAPGDRLVLERFDGYWGKHPQFDRVTMRFIPRDPARIAALLAGDVMLIDQVSPRDVKDLKAGGKADVFSIASTRLVYLALDSSRDRSPFVTDVAGKPLDANPLRDVRVRRAISSMIDRSAIVDRLLEGSGEAAGQMVPKGLGGHDPGLAPPPLDLAGARRLLAEAGWPQGFGLAVHTSSDRFPRDSDIGQAIGQMLTRGGIKVTRVEALPYAIYAAAATRREYSAFVFSFGTTTPDSGIALTNVLATHDETKGTGVFNRVRYANPRFDEALAAALAEFDEPTRNDMLARAARIAFEDVAIVPLYWQVVHWAARKGLAYEPRRDEDTLAMKVTRR